MQYRRMIDEQASFDAALEHAPRGGVTSLLVTNDFPPKIGGIQSYLFELWRRLPPSETTVFTTNYADDKAWDAVRRSASFVRTSRSSSPRRRSRAAIDALAREVGAEVIFVDPWLPLGQLAPACARRRTSSSCTAPR